jgi:putative ABC transport system permease protein
MRPEPPASFKPSLAERLGLQKRINLPLRIALRNLERKPWQATFTTLGLALASGIPILPGAMRDGVDHLLSFEWDVAQRQNASVSLRETGSAQSRSDLARIPGVLKSEPFRTVPVRIRLGNASRRLALRPFAAKARSESSGWTAIPWKSTPLQHMPHAEQSRAADSEKAESFIGY